MKLWQISQRSFAWLTRRSLLRRIVAGLLAFSWKATGGAETSAEETSSPSSTEAARSLPRHITPEADAAILRGLHWLAAQQQADGGFGAPRSYARNVGICALSGMAFLSRSSRHDPFPENVRRCTDYLLAQSQPSGFIVENDIQTHAPMYGHGYATMYLGQVYGQDRRSPVLETLRRAAALINRAQSAEGAWRYTPEPDDADVSVTTCQMMALHSANQAGITIPKNVVQRGLEFLLRCQNPDGGFRYRLKDPPESLFPRSAAAVATLCAFGRDDRDEAVQRGRDYLIHADVAPLPVPHHAEYYYYGRYYAAHAAWQTGEAAWDRWFPSARDELLKQQTADGSWRDPNIGPEYATAMALIVLQFPYNRIPLFWR